MDRLATHYMLEEGEWSWKEAAKQQADSLSTVSTDAFKMQAPKQAIHGLKWNNYITKLYGHVSILSSWSSAAVMWYFFPAEILHCLPEGYVSGIRTRW